MINFLILASCIVVLGLYFMNLNKEKITTKMIVIIGMISALSFVLYLIQFIRYPQGGGISLFSMLPVMLLAILYGRTAGLTAGMIFGLLKLLNGATVVHPAQFLLDYILSTMVLGMAATFGSDKKVNIILGSLFAVVLSVAINILSGAVYFGQYAPKGMNVWWYSTIYNCTSAGVEGILSVIIIAILPINRIRKIINLD